MSSNNSPPNSKEKSASHSGQSTAKGKRKKTREGEERGRTNKSVLVPDLLLLEQTLVLARVNLLEDVLEPSIVLLQNRAVRFTPHTHPHERDQFLSEAWRKEGKGGKREGKEEEEGTYFLVER